MAERYANVYTHVNLLLWLFFVLTRTIKSNCMKYKSSFREIVQIQSIWIWYTFVIKALKFHDHHFENLNSLDSFFSQNGSILCNITRVSAWRNFENFIWQILHIVGGTFFGVLDIYIRHWITQYNFAYMCYEIFDWLFVKWMWHKTMCIWQALNLYKIACNALREK